MADPDDLVRWLAELRVDEAAASRTRERWLRQQAGEEATLVGSLLDLAEQGTPVVLDVAGRRLRGTVAVVAADVCVLRPDDGADHLVAYTGISVVAAAGPSTTTGDRPHALDLTLHEALVALVAERPRLQVADPSGARRTGELVSVGQDVVVLRADGGAGRHLYLPLHAVAAVTITD